MNAILFSADYSGENGQAVVTREVANTVMNDEKCVFRIVYRSGWSFRSIASWIMAICRAFIFITTRKPEFVYIVISRSFFGFVRDIPILAYTFLRGRVVAHCHGSDFEKLLTSHWYSPIARFLYARCEVIFPCSYLARRLECFVAKSHVCENFLADAHLILPALGSIKHSEPLTVLWNSNVMASKGFLDVAEAVRRSVDEGNAVRFISFGAILSDSEMTVGELVAELERYSRYGWFEYLGKVPHKVAVSILQGCDIVALPSRYPPEMQPLAIIEAMCTGRRVVISNSPSLRVTIGDYPAAIVDPATPEAIGSIFADMCKQKFADPIGFASANFEPARAARNRYSVERFRERISFILFRPSLEIDRLLD